MTVRIATQTKQQTRFIPFKKLLIAGFFVVTMMGVYVCSGIFHSSMRMTSNMSMQKSTSVMCSVFSLNQCAMSIIEHLNAWHNTFVKDIVLEAGFMMLATLLLSIFVIRLLSLFDGAQQRRLRDIFRLYHREHRDNRFYDPLLLIFSKGILHPKRDA